MLWVRETFTDTYELGDYAGETLYKATCLQPETWKVRWKPSIYMPRRTSRIDLEIISIRVDRIQNITEEDVIAEGIVEKDHIPGKKLWGIFGVSHSEDSPIKAYKTLWNLINAKRGFSWESNPWVWAIEFRKRKG